MAKKVGDLYVQLKIDSKKFKAGLGKATEGITQFGMTAVKGLAMITAAATTVGLALGKITKDTIRYGVETDRLVKLLNLTGEQVTRLRYAMEQEHGSLQALEKGLFNLTIRLGYAGDEMATYIRYFDTLHIAYKKADGTLRDTYDVFLDLVDVISKGALSTEDMAAAAQLLSARTAKQLIPFMKLGREEIERLGDEAEALGLVMSTETAAGMKKVDDSITALKGSLKGFRNLIGERIAPAVQGFTETMVDSFIKIRKNMDNLIPSISRLGNDTETMGDIGVNFAKKTITAIFTVMNIWTRLTTVYWSVRSAMNRLMQFHNKQYELLFEFTTFWLRKVGKVWDKVFRTSIVAALDGVSEGFSKFNKIVGEEATDNMNKARQSAYDLNRSYETQMAILNGLSPMTLHFGKKIKELGDETDKTKEKIKGLNAEEENLVSTIDTTENIVGRIVEETKDWAEQTRALGNILGTVLKGGKIDAESFLKSMIGIGLSCVPGGGLLKGLLGGLFGMGEGGMTVPRGTRPVFGMQEGGVVATEPAVSPGGVPFGEKGWEVFMKGEQWMEFIKSMKSTFVVHNYTNRDIIVEEIKGTSESGKFELQRVIADEILNKTEALNE